MLSRIGSDIGSVGLSNDMESSFPLKQKRESLQAGLADMGFRVMEGALMKPDFFDRMARFIGSREVEPKAACSISNGLCADVAAIGAMGRHRSLLRWF